jgi:hypothetical protein
MLKLLVASALVASAMARQQAVWTQADLTAATTMGSASSCYYAIFENAACTSPGGVYLINEVR